MSNRQKVFHQCYILNIVENQQPLVVAVEPLNDGSYHPTLFLLPPLRQVEQFGEGDKAGDKAFISLGSNPEDGGVVVGISIGIFNGCLSLANTSQATQGT